MKILEDCFGRKVRLTDERLAHILEHLEIRGGRRRWNGCCAKAIRMTPAMAAGVENGHWTVAELVERCGE